WRPVPGTYSKRAAKPGNISLPSRLRAIFRGDRTERHEPLRRRPAIPRPLGTGTLPSGWPTVARVASGAKSLSSPGPLHQTAGGTRHPIEGLGIGMRTPIGKYTGALTTDVERVFALLCIRERSLLWLAYVEGASHDEIARTVDCAEKSVRVL